MISGSQVTKNLSPSKSPPDMRSALGLLPWVENTMQSTKSPENSGMSTALNFCRSPGCRHGFLVTITSVFLMVRPTPSPSWVIRTKHSPSLSMPDRPFLLVGSHTPKRSRDLGMRIRHRCSSRLFSIFVYSCRTKPPSVELTDSMPSIRSFSARSILSQYDKN
ncbi:hypothetical protein BCR34DRAFT_570146 [Clohesyomyces aquaticus]|uniref:Uncharacterized protein n=1 Tax=Clohesyomyces aquaticus TaxID=1231657 RepID=A0A1Y1ZD02_9PLEO|nr:hypothetical protein BCR34DRAFT_570146 [Clohesyomyces aquaticus]